MKKVIFISLCTLLTLGVFAQKKSIPGPYKNVVKFNPPQFLFNSMNLSYEFRPDISKSFQLFSLHAQYARLLGEIVH